MSAIIEQLGLDQSFFYQFAIFAVFFMVLANVYFKPFLKLLEARHKRTVEDKLAAEKLVEQATAKLEEYKTRIHDERLALRKDYENLLADVKKEEAAILASARNDAKTITQEAIESVSRNRDQIVKQLEGDVDGIATQIAQSLLARND